MSEYLTLDKKYRPRTFGEMVGQPVAVNTLAQMLDSGKLSPTILLYGPLGTGKTTLARMIARYVNCKKNVGKDTFGEICGIDEEPCSSCKSLTAGNAPNVTEINAAEARGINEARELIDQSRFSPIGGARRIFILDEIHQMTSQSSQAMLKPLEEPPKKTMWILCTTEPQKILNTIRSRSLQIKLNPVKPRAIINLLAKITKKEGKTLPENVFETIADLSQGHVRNSLHMLEQVFLYVDKYGVTEQLADNISSVLDEVLSVSPEAVVETYVLSLLNGSNQALNIIRRVDNITYFIKVAISYIKNLIFTLKGLDNLTTNRFKSFLNTQKFERNFGEVDLVHLYELHLNAYERSKMYELDALDLMDLVVMQCLRHTCLLPQIKY